MEWTISGYLIGFILGQFFWGPIGDRHGRRLPVAIGLVLFVIGSAGCALAGSVWTMIGWRIVQAAGACAESISRMPDYGPKYVARISQRFIDTSFGDSTVEMWRWRVSSKMTRRTSWLKSFISALVL